MDDKLILNISKVNPKSLDIELSHFSSDMTFIIYNSDKTFSEELLVTSNSINLNPNIKTLCINIDEESIELENHLLKSNIEYLLEISINDTVIDSSNVLFSNYPAPIQPIVKTYGNRLIQIQFEYPIKHLIDKTTQTSGFAPGGALANFYIKYFNSDVDQGTKPTPTWPGYLIVDVGLDIEPFNATVSNDSRSLLIQSNIKSLPIGNHRLQVATSKIADHSLSGNHLTDFLNRDVPISEIDFMLTASQYSATVETLTVIDPQTVEVKFSSPILDSFGIITVESVASPQRAASHVSSEVQRKRDTLDTLIFKMDSNTFISAGPNSVIVSDVVDCYGLIVNSFKYEANLELPSPELLSVLQDKTSLSETETKLDIIFSHSMNQASLEIKGNYFITKKDSTLLIPVKNIIFNPNFPTQASIILEPQLSSGIYTLRVENLIDIYGSDLINNIKDFSIIDITKPSVISILGTAKESPTDLNDSILIKFSEYMATDNVHGINNGINFKLSPNRVNFTSLESAKATLFKNNSWVRFNLNEKVLLSATPTAESLLRIGYISLDKVFYVTDVSGNIVEFCDTMKVSKLLPILNLDGGSASITESNQITFTLSNSLDPDEMFDDKAFAEDFIFTATNLTEPLIPSIVSVSDDLKSLIFTFVGTIFTSGVTYKMKLNNSASAISTTDILNRPISMNTELTITNELRPEVLSASTVWVDNLSEPNEAILALKLSDKVNIAHINDFIVYNGDNLRLNVSKISIVNYNTGLKASEGTILELTCKSPINTNALATNLLISTTPEVYRYTGFNNRKLKDVSNLSSYELYPLSSKIILDQNSPTDLSKSIFEIIFNKPIDIDETKDVNNVIQVSGTLVTSTGPSPTSYGEFISLASLQFGNILELRSDLSTDSVPLPTDPAKLTFTANLVVSSNKLIISFSSVSNILEYFNSKFIFFELLPVGYKLFASNDGSSLNESVTIKLPFNFPS